MSLVMQKSFRQKAERGVSYTLLFAVLFAFAVITIGIASYVIPDFGLGSIESIALVIFGSGVLLFSMNAILVKVTSGRLRAFSMFLSFMFVAIVLILALVGSGIIEV